MPTHHARIPGTGAPLDRLRLEVATARSAPSATIAGISPGFCVCASDVEPSSGQILTFCFADDVEPSYAVTPGTPCGCFHEE